MARKEMRPELNKANRAGETCDTAERTIKNQVKSCDALEGAGGVTLGEASVFGEFTPLVSGSETTSGVEQQVACSGPDMQ